MVTKAKPVPMPPRPAVMFPSIKKLAFKIPREKKKPESLAVRVGKLWRAAISVDPTGLSCFVFDLLLLAGQWCGANRVSVRKSSRSLLEYESWLKVGKTWDIADWREGRAGQRSRIRASAADPLGLQQLSDSSENLTSRNGSSTALPNDILSKKLIEKEEKTGQRPAPNALHADVNITRHATGWSSSREKARLESEAKKRLPTLPEHRMSEETAFGPTSSSVPGPATVQSDDNEKDHNTNRQTGSNAEKCIANSTSSSLSGMVGRGRKKLKLGS